MNVFGALLGLWTVTTFGKKRLLLVGHSTMALIHAFVGTCIIIEFNLGVVLGICAFMLAYNSTSGPVSWGYAVETCPDIALGIVLLTLYSTVFVLSLTTETLMASPLQPQGVFFMFAGISVIAFVFFWCFLGETKGLTEMEKRSLYAPGQPWGRKLTQSEGKHQYDVTPIISTHRRRPAANSDQGLNKSTVDGSTDQALKY